MKHLHNAQLRVPDRFYNNMNMKCDPNNQNLISIFGRNAVHRIDLNQVNEEKLVFRRAREDLSHRDYSNYDFDAAYRYAMGLITPPNLVTNHAMQPIQSEILGNKLSKRIRDFILKREDFEQDK